MTPETERLVTLILAVLLCLSELLAAIPTIKSNSLLELVRNLLAAFLSRPTPKDRPPTPNA